ncbi:hypothetical protein DFH06DRAFT_1226573 [Mycena polygramma]|nr:hypothetical protein DFH06DRAFT_1226573 [Mycena polygramma]
MSPRPVFSGPARKLVLGIDIGTTYSGMSYCMLEPGKVPDIFPITRFPAQDHVAGDSKVPSVIYYDRFGMPRAFGAEALQESVVEQAEEEGWEKAEWFKLHLRPTKGAVTWTQSIPPLPANKTASDLYADFLRYLFQCAKQYITERYPSGNALWVGLKNTMEIVLTHPNGWEGEQQAKMRAAAVTAGVIPSNQNCDRIHFVTEGEASLHFCIMNGLATDPLRSGEGVVIIDAGGGTVDISAYRQVETPKGDSFEEIARPQCLFEGSIFVSNRAHGHLKAKLRGSKYADDVNHIRDCFDKTTKLRFRNTDQWSYIRFGRPSDKSEALNITSGQMKLSGTVVAGFFKPSLDAIVLAVVHQCKTSPVFISSALLVGGFAASEWLHPELKRKLSLQGLEVSRPDGHVNKAVADGAVSFYLDSYVSARISKTTYGIECITPYLFTNAEHRTRSKTIYTDAAGNPCVPQSFSCILKKDIRVLATKEFRHSYLIVGSHPSELWDVDIDIMCYEGQDQNPRWTDIDAEKYSILCKVYADTSKAASGLKPLQGKIGIYYELKFDVVLAFGLTELKAQISWIENGVEKRGPAEIVY